MGSWFNFKREIGFSEIIAAGALVLAGVALWQSTSAQEPAIHVQNFPVGVGPVKLDDEAEYRFVALVPLVFSSTGGKPSTLLSFHVPEGLPALLFVDDGRVLEESGVEYDFFLSSRMVEHYAEWQVYLPDRDVLELSRRPLLNHVIPPGESRIVYLGITALVYRGLDRVADDLLLAIDAEFSHGAEVPVRASIAVPPVRLVGRP